jgi:hypothetical protein
MSPNVERFVNRAHAYRAADGGARAAILSKTMMMPITTPSRAGRTRAS